MIHDDRWGRLIQEYTHRSLIGVKEVFEAKGLFCSFYSDS